MVGGCGSFLLERGYLSPWGSHKVGIVYALLGGKITIKY